jgi:hypothetical protein
MRIFQTSVKLKRSFTVLATAIILLAAPAGAYAASNIARDHRTPAKVIDHREYVRDHRAPKVPAKGGGVTVTGDKARKPICAGWGC